MPKDLFRRARSRLLTSATVLAVCLCASPAFAQVSAQPPANDRQVQAFFNGIALDQQLTEQYAAPAPQAAVAGQAPAAPAHPVKTMPASAPVTLDEPLDGSLDDAAVADRVERTTIAYEPPGPVQTVLLVLASLALLAFAVSVLTLAFRELKKDAEQRKRTNRRRVKHGDSSTPAHAS